MPYPCRMIDLPALVKDYGSDWVDHLQPGDMWEVNRTYWEHDREHLHRNDLSPEYWRDNAAKRPPLCVVLPSGDWFYVDSKCSGEDHGWTVTGDPPLITVSPSINAIGSYHGWLQNGVLSDDCEGRRS